MKLNGEFFTERRMLASFCLAKKFGETQGDLQLNRILALIAPLANLG
jgi:hypothetical protein